MVERINSWPQSEYLTYRHSVPNLTEIRCAYELRVLGELNPDQNAKVVGFKVASGHHYGYSYDDRNVFFFYFYYSTSTIPLVVRMIGSM